MTPPIGSRWRWKRDGAFFEPGDVGVVEKHGDHVVIVKEATGEIGWRVDVADEEWDLVCWEEVNPALPVEPEVFVCDCAASIQKGVSHDCPLDKPMRPIELKETP